MYAPDADAPLGDACEIADVAEAEVLDLLGRYGPGADAATYAASLDALLDMRIASAEGCAQRRET